MSLVVNTTTPNDSDNGRSRRDEASNLAEWLRMFPSLMACKSKAYAGDYSEDPSVCPPPGIVFRSLQMVGPEDVRVVVLGQDPYHTPGKANGLAFGYHINYLGGTVDSSLLNMSEEARRNGYDFDILTLEHLPPQGVLLLNTCLTVEATKPLSHCGVVGWEAEIQKILLYLIHNTKCVFLLMGGHSLDLLTHACTGEGREVPEDRMIVTSHPSNLSHRKGLRGHRAFSGSGCFDTVNDLVTLHKLGGKIKW